MSSDGSENSMGSRIRQFGLYRTIDARTDEFLRSSKKRQIRQGCACAAISTAITVTVVIITLLIYEYAIAVEWRSVQNKRYVYKNLEISNDQPHAEKLDGNVLGFDQDYFEQMPLLINALQENNYIDNTLEIEEPRNKKKQFNRTISKDSTKASLKPISVRRTSPRPFYFEYRHPAPLPFRKTYASRGWVEKYRNEERLKNIRQIIKYLENTINAKVGDMHDKSREKQIAFTGLYVEPMIEKKSSDNDVKLDLQVASSNYLRQSHLNQLADPLFNFKPESPGEVNLLADNFFRFSPDASTNILGKSHKYPMFRQIPLQNRNCQGNKCVVYSNSENKLIHSSTEIKQTETPPLSTTKSFSVMLNLYPVTPKLESTRKDSQMTTPFVDKIHLTTPRPLVQFKRKSNRAFRRTYTPYKRPKYLSDLISKASKCNNTKISTGNEKISPDTQMIVHVKMYDEEMVDENKSSDGNSTILTSSTQVNPYTTKAPIEFSTSQIGDYHVGSSGYISKSEKADASLAKVTTVIPFLDTTTEYWNSLILRPTEVVKFNAEDAKIPSHFIYNNNKDIDKDNNEGNRRNFGQLVDREQLLQEIGVSIKETPKSTDDLTQSIRNIVPNTMTPNLNNESSKDTTGTTISNKEEDRIEDVTNTSWTYVPHINGHYRSINQNSRNVNKWLNASPDNDRKKRLEQSVSGFHSYNPMYVEIKRNNNSTQIFNNENNGGQLNKY